jgi:hypothetical protein
MISGSSIAAIEVVFFLISFQLLSLSFRIARIRLNLQTRRAGQVRKHSTSPFETVNRLGAVEQRRKPILPLPI